MASNQAKQNAPSPTPAAPTTKAGSQLPKLEPELPVKSLKVDSLAVMKIVKHAREVALSNASSPASGQLLGINSAGVLSVSDAFPLPKVQPMQDTVPVIAETVLPRGIWQTAGLTVRLNAEPTVFVVIASSAVLKPSQLSAKTSMATVPDMEDTKPNVDISSTQPNNTNKNQPQSTRRESSGLRTPITRPGFVPTVTSSQRPAAPSASAPVPQPKRKHNGATIPLASTKENASGLTFRSRGGQEVHVDLAQDSDDENRKAPGSKKDPDKDKDGVELLKSELELGREIDNEH
ncbi:hypothetical protein KEM48_003334 [Puccinia striiformis f. sp. tritici PST-130]|nr:hypothetical protein KEM48_003334 [Puccinia striiformis f. sp. tritici PST-130]